MKLQKVVSSNPMLCAENQATEIDEFLDLAKNEQSTCQAKRDAKTFQKQRSKLKHAIKQLKS